MRAGATKATDLDAALKGMACSQHLLLEQIEPIRESIHACTDITGFGLLGHLGEMLQNNPGLTVGWTVLPSRPTPEHLSCSNAVSPAWPPPTSRLAMAGGPGSAETTSLSILTGAIGGSADLRPAVAGLQQRNRSKAHSERHVAQDRQRNSRA